MGLGNPGREYAKTRHNVGFMVVDELARRHAVEPFKRRFKADVAAGLYNGEKLVLIKPQTYMNFSGHSVREARNWYHADIDKLIVVHDDLDLPFSEIRMRARGSAGGHNGLASVLEQLGSTHVSRLKIGIGRGSSASRTHVLTRFSADEERHLDTVISASADALERWASEGIIAAMNEINGRPIVVPVATPAR